MQKSLWLPLTLAAALFAPLLGSGAQTAPKPETKKEDVYPPLLNDTKPLKYKKAPRGATVLFDGKDASAWQHGDGRPVQWTVENGYMEVKPGTNNILTKAKFSDYELHVEFNIPLLPPDAKSQGRGNSGVYNQGQYEIQILDMIGNETYPHGGCAAIYGQKDPDKNAARPPETWQTYDITFHAPRFDETGNKATNPRITVFWNGVKVHDDVEITIGPTTASLGGPAAQFGPIMLQDHGFKVKFRNLWLKPLASSKTTGDKKFKAEK